MAASMNQNDDGVFAGINVTPLVDITLVLLIIFMVTAPLMATGLDVNLPRADAPNVEMPEDHLVITIDEEGRYLLEDHEFTLEELEVKLPAITRANPDRPVFLRADGSVPYEKVARVLSLCTQAGIPRMGMITQPVMEGE